VNAWKIIEHATDLPIKYWPQPKQNPITSKTHTPKKNTNWANLKPKKQIEQIQPQQNSIKIRKKNINT